MAVLIFLVGTSLGSFLNCLVYRLEVGERPKGRSYCPKCKHQLSYKDLFPLFSYLWLRGKCRYCKEKISIEYPIVEFFTGILFLFSFLFLSNGGIFLELSMFGIVTLIYLFIVLSFFVLIFVYDLKHSIIPDFATFSLIGTSFLYLVLESFIEKDFNIFLSGVLSAIFIFLFFFSLFYFTKGRGMGFGDVKFVIFMGLFLGFPNIILAFFLSFSLGTIIGLLLIFLKRKKLKSEVSFAPFLIIGTFIAYFYGAKIIDIYLSYV